MSLFPRRGVVIIILNTLWTAILFIYSPKVHEFDKKHMKKAAEYSSGNVVSIATKMSRTERNVFKNTYK